MHDTIYVFTAWMTLMNTNICTHTYAQWKLVAKSNFVDKCQMVCR